MTCKNISQSEIRKSSFVAIATCTFVRTRRGSFSIVREFAKEVSSDSLFLGCFPLISCENYQQTWQKDLLRLTLDKWKNLLTTKRTVTRKKKTKNDMALLSSFMVKEKENRQVKEIPPQELDNYLSRFLFSVRKKNGDEYEPSTLRGFIASIEHYLKKMPLQ